MSDWSYTEWAEGELEEFTEEELREMEVIDRAIAQALYVSGDVKAYIECVSHPRYIPDELDLEFMKKLGL